MGIVAKATAKELMKVLSSKSYLEYQNFCRDIISEVLPHTIATKQMKRLDSMGLDLFLLTETNKEIEFGFQCKGFEVATLSGKQIDQCITSIKSLKKLTVIVENYFLLVNRVVLKAERDILEKELEIIRSAGLIKHYEILDNSGLILFLYKYIKENFEKSIDESNNELFKQYQKNLNQKFYYSDVPYELNQRIVKRNPSDYLKENFQVIPGEKKQNDPTHYELSKYFFVLGDFGFGKTSLMFQSMLDLKGYRALYIPFSYFLKTDFQTKLEFVMVINKLITNEDVDNKDVFAKFKVKVLASILISNPKLILLFDGMDENPYLASTEGLRQLFYLLKEIKAKCVFSMRQSFWDERQGNFSVAIPKRRKHKDRIRLFEWEDVDLLNYIQIYKCQNKLNQNQLAKLEDFSIYINSGKYQQFYGDIPKRPLFLEMIIEDVINGDFKETLLCELYEKYFFKKFIWDTESKFDEIPQGRPLTYLEDIYKGFGDMCKVMESIAGEMTYKNDENSIDLKATISEDKVIPIAKQQSVENLNSLLLNSVLTTSSARTLAGIQIKFAHRSFQEYFTARNLYKYLLGDFETCKTIFSNYYSDTIASFLINYIDWKNSTASILKHPHLKLLKEEKWPINSLGDVVRISFKNRIG